MVRPNALAASAKQLTMCCKACSVWATRAQLFSNGPLTYYLTDGSSGKLRQLTRTKEGFFATAGTRTSDLRHANAPLWPLDPVPSLMFIRVCKMLTTAQNEVNG
jgi:hypothetical protein